MELQNFGISEHRIIINRHRGRSAAIQSGLLRPKPRNDNYHVTMQPRNHKHGFSLIELSIVFVVIGILMTGALTFVSGYTKGHQIKETRMKLQAIEQALIVHVRKYGHIPCPASRTTQRGTASFGVSPTLCNTAPPGGTVDVNSGKVRIGMVPVKRLGLPEEHAFDGWGNRITYVAIRDLAVDKDTYNAYTTTDTNGVIIIQDGNGNQLYPVDDKNINAYALISHGSDGKGSFNRTGQNVVACGTATKDSENCDADSLFFDMPINDGDTPASYFNDYIRWKPVTSLNMDANSTNISTATGLPDCAAGETLISNGAGAYACGLPESSGGGSDGNGFEGVKLAEFKQTKGCVVNMAGTSCNCTPSGDPNIIENWDCMYWTSPAPALLAPGNYMGLGTTQERYDLSLYPGAKYIILDAYCTAYIATGIANYTSAGAAMGIAFYDEDQNLIDINTRPGDPLDNMYLLYTAGSDGMAPGIRPIIPKSLQSNPTLTWPSYTGDLLGVLPLPEERLNDQLFLCAAGVKNHSSGPMGRQTSTNAIGGNINFIPIPSDARWILTRHLYYGIATSSASSELVKARSWSKLAIYK